MPFCNLPPYVTNGRLQLPCWVRRAVLAGTGRFGIFVMSASQVCQSLYTVWYPGGNHLETTQRPPNLTSAAKDSGGSLDNFRLDIIVLGHTGRGQIPELPFDELWLKGKKIWNVKKFQESGAALFVDLVENCFQTPNFLLNCNPHIWN